MNLVKILSKVGLVKVTEYNYYDQHILDFQLRQPIPPNKPSPRDDPYIPRPLLCGVPTKDGWETPNSYIKQAVNNGQSTMKGLIDCTYGEGIMEEARRELRRLKGMSRVSDMTGRITGVQT